MVELLVTLGIIAVVIGSVLSIFVAGSRFGLRAQERTEAGRVALAVFDLANRRGAGISWGRYASGNIDDVGTSINNLTSYAQDICTSPLPLVWSAGIVDHTVDGVAMHRLDVSVYFDEDDDGTPSSTDDRLIGTYSAILADREVP